MVETAPRVSKRPKTSEQVQRERLENRQMQETFGDMEFVQDMETKGFSDPLVRLGYGAQDGEGPGARIIPQRLNAAGIYTKQDDPQANAFREEAGFESGDVGDVYTIGDFQGSNTVWSHEIRHRGLGRLREVVGQDIDGFVAEYLPESDQLTYNLVKYVFQGGGNSEEALIDLMDHDSPDELGFPLEQLTDDTESKSENIIIGYNAVKDAVLRAAEDMNRAEGSPPRTPRWDAQDPEPEAEKGFFRRLFGYAEGGLVSKNAMSDYFLASSGKMTEVEFVGKHKMSTLEFERQFAEDNNVDITGTEKLSEVATGPKGMKMDYSKKPKTMAEGGIVGTDPVSGNDIPIGSTPENVRDDIPAMLSEGEYVIPADVLKYFGVNFFEKLRTKAKQGMMEMEADGRTGKEPMAAPMEEMPPQEEAPMMAEGGLVPTPSFDPLAWTTPGFGGAGQPGAGQPATPPVNDYRQYYGPGGISQMILFVDGVPATPIPEGYTTAVPTLAATGSEPSDAGDRSTSRTQGTGTGNPGQGPDLGGLFGNPLSELDFTNPESIDTWAADKLERSVLQRGLGMAGVGGALGSTALELRHIAEVSAAGQYYASIGNQESSDRLMGMANEARENYGVIGSWSEKFSDGDRIFQNYQESLAGRPAAASRSSGAERVSEAEYAAKRNAEGAGIKASVSTAAPSEDGRDYRNNSRNQSKTHTSTNTSSSPSTGKVANKSGGTKDENGRNKGGLVTKRTTKKK
jgi:hypothetical protein